MSDEHTPQEVLNSTTPQIRGLVDNAFGQTETGGKILKFGRCNHHHYVGALVIGQGHRHFRCDLIIVAAVMTFLPVKNRNLA